MIHIITEGAPFHIGLNVHRSRGGVVFIWAWYDAPRHELTVRRMRIRLHMRPWLLFSRLDGNVIDEHLRLHDLVLVSREVLEDTRAVEEAQHRRGDAMALVKKQAS
jgi:hypothetical protein